MTAIPRSANGDCGRKNLRCWCCTIGHSTRSIEEFIGLLDAHSVKRVVDVLNRFRVPGAILNSTPKHFGLHFTPLASITLHMPELGGLRHPSKNSINSAWRNTSFRGYADHMQTSEFQQALDRLIQSVQQGRIAVMCAEAVPWRCHRSLIADALLVRGIRSENITSRTRRRLHALTPFARVDGTRITYPAQAANLEMSFCGDFSKEIHQVAPAGPGKKNRDAVRFPPSDLYAAGCYKMT